MVATFVFILPRIADYRDVWGVVKTLSWTDVALLFGAVLLNLVTFAPPWMAALPGLRFPQAFVVTQASTASTYVAPAGVAVGMALSYAMLRAWGFASAAVGLAVALTGIWNQLAMLAFPAIALALLALTGDAHTALDTIAAIGLAIFVAVVAAFAAGLARRRSPAGSATPRRGWSRRACACCGGGRWAGTASPSSASARGRTTCSGGAGTC